ncbi:MAG: FHA domain-containing protein [Ilumatobacter sp.]|uniref:FHA domain-containing protein n=1 Tax=Ilumatobacter sp. TaxID=1967498 RepID=UPI003C75C7F1
MSLRLWVGVRSPHRHGRLDERNTVGMNYEARLGVASGAGWITRRDHALLFFPDGTADGPTDDLAERFRAFDDDHLADSLRQHVLDGGASVPAFVYIEWPNHSETNRIQVILRGDVELSSDLGSMSSLSGAGSSTWVEHRALRHPYTARFWCGTTAETDTDLRAGTVSTAGFELDLSTRTVEQVGSGSNAEQKRPAPVGGATASASSVTSDGPPREAEPATSLMSDEGDDRSDVAVGQPRLRPRSGAKAPITTGIDALAAAVGEDPMDESTMGEVDLPSSAPATPDTLPTPGADLAAVANLAFGDRAPIALSETVVIGRLPSLADARREAGRLATVTGSMHVSRTHCVVDVDGWTITVTDCASTGGTVVLAAGADEPVVLTPWQSHDVAIGDTIRLGGATSVRLTDPDPN